MTLSTAHDAEGGHLVFPLAREGQGGALQRATAVPDTSKTAIAAGTRRPESPAHHAGDR